MAAASTLPATEPTSLPAIATSSSPAMVPISPIIPRPPVTQPPDDSIPTPTDITTTAPDYGNHHILAAGETTAAPPGAILTAAPGDGNHHIVVAGESTATPPAAASTALDAQLTAVIINAQVGDASASVSLMPNFGGALASGETGVQLVSSLSASARGGVASKGIQDASKAQTSAGASTALAASSDRQHTSTSPILASDSSNTDASDASGDKAQEQGAKSQIADAILPRSGTGSAHPDPVTGPLLVAIPASAHAGSHTQALPVQSTPTPAAYFALLHPEMPTTPLVNSARLIQSIQQSDMRVGLNSEEFGAISIHTTTEHGVLSSEITLAHEELARTLTTHLATMQDVPGIPQSFSVRIDTSSATSGSLTSTSEQSSQGRQQNEAGRATPSHNAGSQPWAQQSMPIATRNFSSNDGHAGRLDIRI